MSILRKVKGGRKAKEDPPIWPNTHASKSERHVHVRAIKTVSDSGIEAGKEYLMMPDAVALARAVGWAEIVSSTPGVSD